MPGYNAGFDATTGMALIAACVLSVGLAIAALWGMRENGYLVKLPGVLLGFLVSGFCVLMGIGMLLSGGWTH
jgi:hypothetical protein